MNTATNDSPLSSEQVRTIVQLVGLTRDQEFNCEECLHHVGEFAERELAGQPVDEVIAAVEHHLSLCLECREEYTALKKILETSP